MSACYTKSRRSIITRIDILTSARLTRDRSLVEIKFSPKFDVMKDQSKGISPLSGFLLVYSESSSTTNLPTNSTKQNKYYEDKS